LPKYKLIITASYIYDAVELLSVLYIILFKLFLFLLFIYFWLDF